MRLLATAALLGALFACSPPQQSAEQAAPPPAAETPAPPVRVDLALATETGPGASVGAVTLRDTPEGVALDLDLHGLSPGQHGFHLHENPDCAPNTNAEGVVTPAGAAGAHWDPAHSGQHLGPEGQGHMGDLPRFDAPESGAVVATLIAPRLQSVESLRGRVLMVHAGGDNYSDTPAPLGGGGARFACGVIG